MNVDGQFIINERTEKSSRFLLTIGSTVVLIKYFSVPIEDLTVFNVKAPTRLFDVVAITILTFSLASFLIHWFGDFVNWRVWYKENAVSLFLGKEATLGQVLNAKLEELCVENTEAQGIENLKKDIVTLQKEIVSHNI